MKRMKQFTLLALAAAAMTLSGCAATRSSVADFVAAPRTETRQVEVPAATNQVVETQSEAGPGGEPRTITVTNFVTVPAHAETREVVTGYVANPKLLTGLAVGQELNGALNATPSAPILNWVFGLLGTAAAAFAGWRTRQLNLSQAAHAETRDALGAAGRVAQTVVKAVELFKGGTGEELKATILTHAKLDGTQPDLHAVVKAVTGA